MLSQLQSLSKDTEGRYANDAELQFIGDFIPSFNLRLQTYVKICSLENTIVEQVQNNMKSLDPSLFRSGAGDITDKWRQDTLRVLRYSAIAMLTDDTNRLKDQFLYWFQTIMQAFGAERSCNATYTVMQEVINKVLTSDESQLFCPILELNRNFLGEAAKDRGLG